MLTWEDQTKTSSDSRTTVRDFGRTGLSEGVLNTTGHLRSRVRIIEDDAKSLGRELADQQHSALEDALERRTTVEARKSVRELLEELGDLGFAWRDIARLLHVSVPSLRKWRLGEQATGANRRSVARLTAFVRLLADEHLVSDVASWLEMPLSPDYEVNGLDLYEAGRSELLYDLASLNITAEEALDAFRPQWRELVDRSIEVFLAPDGEIGIRQRDNG